MSICHINDIVPGTGVCALIDNQQVAIFRPNQAEKVYGISNIDPFANASVLSRGLICEHQDQLWVASPLKKQRFNLQTGECLEDNNKNIQTFQLTVKNKKVVAA